MPEDDQSPGDTVCSLGDSFIDWQPEALSPLSLCDLGQVPVSLQMGLATASRGTLHYRRCWSWSVGLGGRLLPCALSADLGPWPPELGSAADPMPRPTLSTFPGAS